MSSVVFQGNSNSLATIDVAAGYVGLSDYNPVIICLLMFASTYAGPIYWLLALNEQLATTFVSR
jgi:ethanolaminephosphotransferase